MKRLGIIGGLGTETGCNFVLNVNSKFRRLSGQNADVVLENVAVPKQVEAKIVSGDLSMELFVLLSDAVSKLNDSDVDFIVIPCNSVHVFIDDLRKLSKKPVLSIVEECCNFCISYKLKTVGLIASQTTINQELYENLLKKSNIKVLKPDNKNQRIVNDIIISILDKSAGKKELSALLRIAQDLRANGAENVILGCTDLPLII